mmetsp:Transcript_25726/g.46612  ORF Transcript_25726/g.46612 Transcript_25726/m.46612 type:complete len:245 (+) Transcript_25726:465-1199(+)
MPMTFVTVGSSPIAFKNFWVSNTTPYSCKDMRILRAKVLASLLSMESSLFVSLLVTMAMISCTTLCRKLSLIRARISPFSFTNSTSLVTLIFCFSAMFFSSCSTAAARSASGPSKSISSAKTSTCSPRALALSLNLLFIERRDGIFAILCSLTAAYGTFATHNPPIAKTAIDGERTIAPTDNAALPPKPLFTTSDFNFSIGDLFTVSSSELASESSEPTLVSSSESSSGDIIPSIFLPATFLAT